MESFGAPFDREGPTVETKRYIPKGMEDWEESGCNDALNAIDHAVNDYIEQGRIKNKVFGEGEYAKFYKETRDILPAESLNDYLRAKGIHFSSIGLEEKPPRFNLTSSKPAAKTHSRTETRVERVKKDSSDEGTPFLPGFE